MNAADQPEGKSAESNDTTFPQRRAAMAAPLASSSCFKRSAADPTREEARRIAMNIARLPGR